MLDAAIWIILNSIACHIVSLMEVLTLAPSLSLCIGSHQEVEGVGCWLTWGLDHDLRAGDQFGRVEPFPEVPNVQIHLNSKAIVENALVVHLVLEVENENLAVSLGMHNINLYVD